MSFHRPVKSWQSERISADVRHAFDQFFFSDINGDSNAEGAGRDAQLAAFMTTNARSGSVQRQFHLTDNIDAAKRRQWKIRRAGNHGFEESAGGAATHYHQRQPLTRRDVVICHGG